MTVLTISLPQRKLAQLRRFAARIGVSPSELVRGSVEDLLSKPDAEFEKAAARVLKKNAALYKRLA
jgi:metal-responsive CopG/Arc/MetJ family transcriptional regulator